MKVRLASLIVVSSICSSFAEPGGTYTLTGEEKGIAEIVKADMAKYPDLYKGETFNRYLSKFKVENKIGRKKYKPGDQLQFPHTSASLAKLKSTSKDKSPENELPKNEAEFKEWLIGTEWYTKGEKNDGTMYAVRRFFPGGVMKMQIDTKKWDEEASVVSWKYHVTGPNKFQFGAQMWAATMDRDFEKFKAVTEKETCKGYFIKRFDINQNKAH